MPIHRQYSFLATALAAFWALYGLNAFARSQWQQNYLQAQSSRPPVLNGLLFRQANSKPDTTSAGRQLVLVTSDSCRFSQTQVPEWLTFASELKFLPTDSVTLVSLNGDSLPRRMAKRLSGMGIPHRIQVLTGGPKAVFMLENGVAWTPDILIIDEHRRIRLSAPRLTAAVREELARWFSGQHEPSRSTVSGASS